MKQIKEIGIPVILWMFFMSQGISGGLEIAGAKIEPNDEIPFKFRLIILSVAFLMFFFITLVNYLRPQMNFELKLEKLLSKESYKVIGNRVKLYLLGSLFFGSIGIAGLIKCNIIHSPVINGQILQIPLIVGLGIFSGGLLGTRIKSRRIKT